jgi:hypothetical protein
MQHLRTFVMSEGRLYQSLEPASQDIQPRAMPGALADGLDGWSFLARVKTREFALAYFENRAPRPRLAGFEPGGRYRWTWFDPESGRWGRTAVLRADADGNLSAPPFPSGGVAATRDIAAKILLFP